ncbi:MAG: CoA transferase [Micavibrio aeruginosavorus]|uniref:CoA transferase n=1 Tax=Micavibrio aeruginosavorus TaxID=349221 RepID=A0A2W5HFT5_9BACT|nr:MAG: CoA transferase [Micavibrio aeruginosavorus]
MTGPLKGLRILDLSRVLAGPYCTQMMGDMGAEIIKIEKPFAGDDTRFWGPPFLQNEDEKNTNESAYYLSINRNKKSVAIDIAHTDGQAIILKILESCDILIENFKVGSLAKYGLSYDQLKEKFPKLIYCSITGFGQNGPLASEPGYDLVSQAMGGLMATTGEINGAPMKAGVAVSDIMTGLHAGIGILAALNHRHQTGKGQYIDLALLDCTLATMTNLAQYYLTSGQIAPRQGNAHSTIAPYQSFQAKDGWLVIAVGNDHQFSKLCMLLNAPDLALDDRFRANSLRVLHKEELTEEISRNLATRTVADIVNACRELDIPAGPINSLDKTFAEPQVVARDMKISIDGIDLVGSPLKFSGTPVQYQSKPPTLGLDTTEILSQLGYSESQIKTLADAKIIQTI